MSGLALSGSIITAAAAPREPVAQAPATPPPPRAAAPAPAAGAMIDETRLQKRANPVRCQGTDSVKLDGVLLQADRVAVQALAECNVHIVNSRIVGRIAVMALGKSNVTIENSIIEGRTAIQASGNSQTSVRSSTIRGRVQKLQTGAVKDVERNVWK